MGVMMLCFFFSSRRRHTRWTGDWSSDVCSSDLGDGVANFIEQFSNDRLFVFAERSHLLAARGDAAAFAEVLDARGLERLLVRRGLDLAHGVVAQLFERVSHGDVEALKRNT